MYATYMAFWIIDTARTRGTVVVALELFAGFTLSMACISGLHAIIGCLRPQMT